MIERHAVGHAAAAIVTCHGKARPAELAHDFDKLERHGALRIGRMIGHRDGATTAAIAAKISTENGETICQQGRDAAPHQVVFGKAVQQQEGRTRAG